MKVTIDIETNSWESKINILQEILNKLEELKMSDKADGDNKGPNRAIHLINVDFSE